MSELDDVALMIEAELWARQLEDEAAKALRDAKKKYNITDDECPPLAGEES